MISAGARSTRFRQLVLGHLRASKGSLCLAAACMLGLSLTEVLAPWPLKVIFDHVLLGKPLSPSLGALQGLLATGPAVFLVVVSLAILAIAVFRGSFSYAQVYLTSRIGNQTVYVLRRELFAHIQRLSLAFHTRTGSGELLTKIAGDTNTLKDVAADSVLTFTGHLVTLVAMLSIMLWLSPTLTAIVLVTFPVLVYALLYLYREIKASAKQQREKEGRIAARITEMLGAVPLVQAYGRERHEAERFDSESAQTLRESVRTARMEAAASRTVEVISAVGTWAAVLFGGLQVLRGTMTPGEVLIFTSYLTSMYKPIRNLAKLATRFSKAMVSAQRITEVLELRPDICDVQGALSAAHLGGPIEFVRVSFDYGDGRPILEDISFTLARGQRVALVGSSGVGKSTIANLLLRFYDPTAGRILLDGKDLRHYSVASVREQIAVVLQDSVLFGTTIAGNIAYGKVAATREEIVEAARAANAHDFILALDKGYDTIVGERGCTLSGGQRRRIAIARALVRNAPILVLDEPMAGLDVESEAKVREALARLMEGRTCLMITHDLRAAAAADVVVLLDRGRVVAYGSHRRLLTASREYRRLWDLVTPPAVEDRVDRPASSTAGTDGLLAAGPVNALVQ